MSCRGDHVVCQYLRWFECVLEFSNGIHVLLAVEVVCSFESVHEVIKCFDNDICRGDLGLCTVFAFEIDRVEDAGGVHSLDKDKVCAIVCGEVLMYQLLMQCLSHV